MDKNDFTEQRLGLVRNLSFEMIIKSPLVKEAFSKVKREIFVSKQFRKQAYLDVATPLILNQTLSQPSVVATMLEMLKLERGQEVLEIGSGSGYVTALLSEIVGREGKVYGIEYLDQLADVSRKNLRTITNALIKQGDGSKGWTGKKTFDRIIFSCACHYIPKPVFDQLKEGGFVVAPVGDRYIQSIQVIKKVKGNLIKIETTEPGYVFVALKGKYGFQKDDY